MAIDDWWRANRGGAARLFRHELAIAVRQLRRAPGSATRYDASPIAGLRRLIMGRTRYHVYFGIDDVGEVVNVVAVWHASRGAGPR